MHPLQLRRPGRQGWHTTPGGGFSWIFHQPPQSWDQFFTTKPPFRVAQWLGIYNAVVSSLKTSPRHGVESGVTKPPWQWARRALSTRVLWSLVGPLAKTYHVSMVWAFLESLLRNRGISKSAEQFGGDLQAYLYHPLPRKVCFAGLWCEMQRFCWRHQWSERIRWGLDVTTWYTENWPHICVIGDRGWPLSLRLYPSCISHWHHFLSQGQEVTRVPVTHTHIQG